MFKRIRAWLSSGSGRTAEQRPQLAMPLFSTTDPLAPAAVADQWLKLFPRQPALSVTGEQEAVVQYSIGGSTVMVAHMPMPIPNSEAVDAIRTSWMWQAPDDAVRDHRAHAIVTAFGSRDPLTDAWTVARISACLLKAASGAALYWGSSGQVHLPVVVEQFAAEEETPPVPLWMGITISAAFAQGPFSAATHGLDAFGHKEFEVIDTSIGVGELRETLLDIALYVLRHGPVLRHGHTFGPSADVKWPISHAKSKLVPGRDAIVVGIP